MNPFLERVLEVASREVGVREVGRNRGQRIEEYQHAAGAQPGDPWCAAFVSWVFQRAADEMRVAMPFHATAGALKMWRQNSGARRDVPEPGYVFVLDHGVGLGHVGLIEDVFHGMVVSTIEGNTNDGGGREGDGVYRRTRTLGNQLLGFLAFPVETTTTEVG